MKRQPPYFLPTRKKTAPAANVDARASLIYYSITAVLEREGVEVYSIVQSHSEWKSGPLFIQKETPRLRSQRSRFYRFSVTCLNESIRRLTKKQKEQLFALANAARTPSKAVPVMDRMRS